MHVNSARWDTSKSRDPALRASPDLPLLLWFLGAWLVPEVGRGWGTLDTGRGLELVSWGVDEVEDDIEGEEGSLERVVVAVVVLVVEM